MTMRLFQGSQLQSSGCVYLGEKASEGWGGHVLLGVTV